MSERKFRRLISSTKPGSAAQARKSVAMTVRHSSIMEQELTFLQLGHSQIHGPENLLKHLFSSYKSLINDHPVIFFGPKAHSNNVEMLCLELLKCCSSNTSSVRSESASLLYLLMRANFNFSGQLSMIRVHLEIMIAVSKLLGNSSQLLLLKNSRFFESLTIINCFAASDVTMENTKFPSNVRDVTKRVRNILMAASEMREHESDPEMLMDLQFKIANSYSCPNRCLDEDEISCPLDSKVNYILRKTWLNSMAQNHLKQGNISEAASCLAHISALEFLVVSRSTFNDGAGDVSLQVQDGSLTSLSQITRHFSFVSPNIPRDEFPEDLSLLSDQATTSSTSNNDNSDPIDNFLRDHFNESSLIEVLENSIKLYSKCERFELIPEFYKIMISIYESRRSYHCLSKTYANLSSVYDKLVDVTKNNCKIRIFGKYYRVVFYGKDYFGDEFNCKEYIYKEPNVTSLPEIAERLKNIFGKKFGFDNIKLIMTEKEIDPKEELDPKLAYIQVNHVHPWNHVSDSIVKRNGDRKKNHRVSILVNNYEKDREEEEKEIEEQTGNGFHRRKSLPTRLSGDKHSPSQNNPTETPTFSSTSSSISINTIGDSSSIATIKDTYYDSESDRKTDFEKFEHNLNKFMFETPFSLTDPCRTHSTTCVDQCKKRTILTADHCFPYILKRIPIVSKKVIVLSPIEVAIDEMSTRVKELNDVISGSNKSMVTKQSNMNGFSNLSSDEDLSNHRQLPFKPDIKRLQLKLQGSVSVTVNAGPLSYARAFLSPDGKDSLGQPFTSKNVSQLRKTFRDFVEACSLALALNEQLIATDQLKYHQSLKNNFQDMVTELGPYLSESESVSPSKKSSPKKHQRSTSTSTVVTISRNSSDQSIASNGSSQSDALSFTSSGISSSSSVVKRLSNRSVELFEKISGTGNLRCSYNTQ